VLNVADSPVESSFVLDTAGSPVRIYQERHTPQKGMGLIFDTMSQVRARWTHLVCRILVALRGHSRGGVAMSPNTTPLTY
jgi:hypothetical protein